MLNQTNIGHNNNKYYIIQLLQTVAVTGTKVTVPNITGAAAGAAPAAAAAASASPLPYAVWTRWGRVGEVGEHNMDPHATIDAAKKAFAQKFQVPAIF